MKNSTKKKIISLAIIASVSLLTAQYSMARPGGHGNNPQGDQGGEQAGTRGEISISDIMSRMDYDGDGIISSDDLVNQSIERSEKHFERMDSDQDGLVSYEEMTSRERRRTQNDSIDEDALKQCIEETTGVSLHTRLTAEEAFLAADSNADDYLSLDEFQDDRAAHAQSRFDEIDSNSDGTLSEEEISLHIEERQAVREAHKSCVDEQILTDVI